MGLFCAGIFIAMFVGLGDPAEWYDLHREPFSIDTRETNKITEEINRRMRERDPQAEPLPTLPVIVRNDPGGFDWEAFRLLLMNHAFIVGGLIAGVVGFRIMFTGTTVSFDKRRSLVEWKHTGIRRASSTDYELSQVGLVLHETVIRNPRGFDWHGFAASLVNKDNATIQLARSKKMEALRQYTDEFQTLTGIEVKEIGAEQTPAGDVLKAAPEE
ncbi:MAG: hypothetical protein PHI84_21550 [Kiritimatiellae bacterium]|nr:hypothetical protein [Kiritimatiellia bacterium]